MTFTSRVLVLALVCCYIFSTTQASSWKLGANTSPTLHEKVETQNHIIDSRISVEEPSGRSFIIKSLLLAPLGIALLLLAGLILIPIPVISTGRAFTMNNRAIDLAKKVMTSEECVERMACEVSNFTKRYEVTSWIPRSIESYMKSSAWMGKLSRGFKADSCYRFRCNPMKSLSQADVN